MSDVNILDVPMQENDANASSVRDYLKMLLRTLWREGEGFSGKRPFGNSGWESEIYAALVISGAVAGKVDSEGYLDECDEKAADKLILAAIDALT